MATADKSKELVEELRKRISNEKPLEGEEFHAQEETLLRFLKAREWNIDAAEKQLREAVEWRRNYKPLNVDCSWCHQHPGFHSMRQVGFDELGRPVIYSCFAQADTNKNSVEDSIAHCTYLIENAKRTMRPGVTTWIFVIDCSGMALPMCNPRLGYSVTQVLSNYYPERLGKVFCVNHSVLFHGVWNAMKVFMHPTTAAKMVMLRGKRKIREQFESIFPQDLTDWLIDEISRNKSKKHLEQQKIFYRKPKKLGSHDPRGSASYVQEFVDGDVTHQSHRPHPNICDFTAGILMKDLSNMQLRSNNSLTKLESCSSAASLSLQEESDDDIDEQCNGAAASIEIPEEYAIPADAVPQY